MLIVGLDGLEYGAKRSRSSALIETFAGGVNGNQRRHIG